MPLTPKQERFIAEYLIDLNGKQAAIRAGYSPKSAESQASVLLTDPNVSQAVEAGKARQLASAELSAVRVLEEYRRLAFVDLRGFFDDRGNLKAIKDLTPDQGAALASFEVIKKNAEAGDGVIDTVHKFKVWDKGKSLEALAKHFGLLEEKLDVTGELRITWEK